GQAWLAVGEGTARALRRAGVSGVLAPTRMDSEGVLALPALSSLRGRQVAQVTAPGGRGLIAPSLPARGAQVLRADVYKRVPASPAPQALARLRGLRAPLYVALGSGEALQRLLDVLPADLGPRLRRARVFEASDRLAAIVRAAGFDDVVVAADA